MRQSDEGEKLVVFAEKQLFSDEEISILLESLAEALERIAKRQKSS